MKNEGDSMHLKQYITHKQQSNQTRHASFWHIHTNKSCLRATKTTSLIKKGA